MTYAFRAATPTDAERITAITMEGFETYRAFAPEGWAPPPAGDERARLLRLLAEDWVFYRVAEHDGELVGHVGFLPAERTFAPTGDPALAHFRQLFVARAHWGTGLAAQAFAAATISLLLGLRARFIDPEAQREFGDLDDGFALLRGALAAVTRR